MIIMNNENMELASVHHRCVGKLGKACLYMEVQKKSFGQL